MYSKLAVELLVILAVSSTVFGASVSKKSEENQVGKDLSIIQKVYDDCENKEDFTGCLKGKALTAISRAVEQVSINTEFSNIHLIIISISNRIPFSSLMELTSSKQNIQLMMILQ